MKSFINALIIIAIIAIAAVLIFGGGRVSDSEAAYFMDEAQAIGTERIGQPIEGFDAAALMRAFPLLQDSDFDKVETAQGKYQYRDGVLSFRNTSEGAVSSAEEMLTQEGYETLLENVADRLDLDIDSESDVDAAIEVIGNGFEDESAMISGMIVVDAPVPDETVASPLFYSGEAVGSWFSEGEFEVVLTDWDGNIIGESMASAQVAEGEEMEEGAFTPFFGTIEYETPDVSDELSYGFLVFRRANPSGLSANDDALEFRVDFE